MKSSGNQITAKTRLRPGSWQVVARLVWILLFLVHVYPCVSVSAKLIQNPSSKLFVSFGAIVAIMAFAALKAVDAYALRLELNRRKFFSLVVLGLFFHGDVVTKQLPDMLLAEPTVVLVGCLLAARRNTLHKLAQQTDCCGVESARNYYYTLVETYLPKPFVPVCIQLVSPRPPPVR
ncbi:MAG TPA: hypothetical protein PKD72_13345 [Gemmatales bacterium]|nr:hypothetical protein [Gemmatales bacterium]